MDSCKQPTANKNENSDEIDNSQKKAKFNKKQNTRALQSLESPSYDRNKTARQRHARGPGASGSPTQSSTG